VGVWRVYAIAHVSTSSRVSVHIHCGIFLYVVVQCVSQHWSGGSVGIHPITTVLVINQRELRDRRKCSAYVRGARTPRTLYSIRAHVESLTHVTSYVRSLTSVLSTVCQGWQVSCVRIASDRTHM
jgi:hypothetical protein